MLINIELNMKTKIQKIIFKIFISLFHKKDSTIYCHSSGKFYAIYYSDLKKWVVKDGDYCNLKK